jgi:hypothetical protein
LVDEVTNESEVKKLKLKEKIKSIEAMIDLIDNKIKEKIESDVLRSRVGSQTHERELESHNLRELKDLKESYRKELAEYKSELADLESEDDRLNARFIKSTYSPR